MKYIASSLLVLAAGGDAQGWNFWGGFGNFGNRFNSYPLLSRWRFGSNYGSSGSTYGSSFFPPSRFFGFNQYRPIVQTNTPVVDSAAETDPNEKGLRYFGGSGGTQTGTGGTQTGTGSTWTDMATSEPATSEPFVPSSTAQPNFDPNLRAFGGSSSSSSSSSSNASGKKKKKKKSKSSSTAFDTDTSETATEPFCSPLPSTCFGECCADTTMCEISVTAAFYGFSASDCDGGDCSTLSVGAACPIACDENSYTNSIYLAIPDGQTVTSDTCFSWPGAAGQNSQNNGQCNGDGSYTWDQFAGNCDCSAQATTKTLSSTVCVVDTKRPDGSGICGMIHDLGSCD